MRSCAARWASSSASASSLSGASLEISGTRAARRRAVLLGRPRGGARARAARGGRRSPSRTGSSWPGCARGSRTTGRGRRPGCSTRSPRCAGSPTRRLLIDFASLSVRSVPLSLGGVSADHAGLGRGAHARRRRLQRAAGGVRRGGRASWAWRACARRRWRWLRICRRPYRCGSGTWSARTSGCLRRWRRSNGVTWRSSAACSTPRTPACATATRCPPTRSRTRWRGASEAGALGVRIMGGGFGGNVLALLPADAAAPDGAVEVRPGPGARVSTA